MHKSPMQPAPPELKGRRTRQRETTRALIVTTAARLFRERGFEAVNFRDLAAEMDRSTGSIFAHFRNKEEVWTAAIGGPPPDFAMAEQLALLQGERPDAGWILCGRPDGQFEAHAFERDGHKVSATGPSAEKAVAALRAMLSC